MDCHKNKRKNQYETITEKQEIMIRTIQFQFKIMVCMLVLYSPISYSNQIQKESGKSAGNTVQFPEFSFKGLNSELIQSRQYAGKIVLVDFWATWCQSCEETAKILNQIQESYSGKDIQILGISIDNSPPEKIKKGAQRWGITYPIALDPDNSLADMLGFNSIPALYLFDKRGNLVDSFHGIQKQELKKIQKRLDELIQTSTGYSGGTK